MKGSLSDAIAKIVKEAAEEYEKFIYQKGGITK
jgi:hypothetical protein